jgi:hypothetical protein
VIPSCSDIFTHYTYTGDMRLLLDEAGEGAGYISLSQHFRQLQEQQQPLTIRWETDSGLGDSPPPTPSYEQLEPPHQLEAVRLTHEPVYEVGGLWEPAGIQRAFFTDGQLNPLSSDVPLFNSFT